MIDQQKDIPTRSGPMASFITRPERGGPHPAIFLFMDAGGIREELRDMARRLATSGYCVILPNLYHREGPDTEYHPGIDIPGSPEQLRTMARYMAMRNAMVVEDAEGLLAFIDQDPAVRKGPVGCVGYCMSGAFSAAVAAAFPDRIAAAASIYGTKLVTDQPDSPHRVLGRAKAELYFAWAEHDEHAPTTEIEPLRQALTEAKSGFEIELYPGTKHGFAFPRRAWFDKLATERHWERLYALFRRRLDP